jgi:histidinol phosphatase-like PHP family hydrolase
LLNRTSSVKEIDLHIHTRFSDGRNEVEDILGVARAKRLKIIAITDHYSEFQPLPKRMSKGLLREYLEVLEGKAVLKGVEAEILADGMPSISKNTRGFLEVVLGGLHILHDTVFWDDPKPILDQEKFVEDIRITLVKCMESHLVDVINHVTWLPEAIRSESDSLITADWVRSVVKTASDYGVAIELNSAWKVPDEFFVKECVHQGVKLSIGSDAHEASRVGEVSYAQQIMKSLNISADLIFIPAKLL